jgi:proline iminopeptidase
MHVFGGSWGSTLSLVYAIRHPQNVRSLILRGIFLGERGNLDYMYQGNAETYAAHPYALTAPGAYIFYPEQWRAFLEPIPDDQRGNVAHAYKAIFDQRPTTDEARARQLEAAVAWSVWEGAISNRVPAPAGADKFSDPEFAVCFAQIEAHYFANHLFLDEGYIVRSAARLAALPIYIVHGRFDQACPLSQAGRLVEALERHGARPLLVTTDAGHSAMEAQTVLALTAIMDGLPR